MESAWWNLLDRIRTAHGGLDGHKIYDYNSYNSYDNYNNNDSYDRYDIYDSYYLTKSA